MNSRIYLDNAATSWPSSRATAPAKAPAHGINTIDFIRPVRAMYQIGG